MTIQPVASLSPTLLARKGAARPAMRPQLQPLRAFQENTARQLDDLGWNDMGNDVPDGGEPAAEVSETPLVALEPIALETAVLQAIADAPIEEGRDEPASAEIVVLNPVAEVIPALKSKPAKVREPKPRRSALSDGRRAAFTLRLDSERHLKLRLACVTSNRSAQQLLIDALDRLIADLPDVAALATKVREGR